MELKTLKDILPCVMKKRKCRRDYSYHMICSGCFMRWRLEKEAAKWVKADCDYNDWRELFRHFFNITEEDLK